MKHTGKVVGLLVGLVIVVLFQLVAMDDGFNGDEVNCYDKYGNLIVGTTCILESSFDNELQARLVAGMLGLVFLGFFFFAGFVFDDTFKDTPRRIL